MHIGLDFETYSPVNLKKHGLDRYVGSPFFRPLIAGLAWSDQYGKLGSTWYDLTDSHSYSSFCDDYLTHTRANNAIIAHNAGFEKRVLQHMHLLKENDRIIDSAVTARAAGASGTLERAAVQLLDGATKLSTGRALIQRFSVPSKQQIEDGDLAWDESLKTRFDNEWQDFGTYCAQDASVSLQLEHQWGRYVNASELEFAEITEAMNERGWPVDVEMVEEMNRRYLHNVEDEISFFRTSTGADELNLNSTTQLRAWCKERGINATSFDADHVAKMLPRIRARITTLQDAGKDVSKLQEIELLLVAKQVIGGSSLKKLATILDTVGEDGRLRNQYVHIGAPRTRRTSGRSVQMQNLKRLGDSDNPSDMNELLKPAIWWSNDQLAENLRQVFTSSDPQGQLIVADFASIEARGLAWAAGAKWKLEAFFNGQDMYRVLASKIYDRPYGVIGKHSPERQVGKVGELACGYQASGPAVKDFAEKMGVAFTEAEAVHLVSDWRRVNPEIVDLWSRMDAAMREALEGKIKSVQLNDGWYMQFMLQEAPESLKQQTKGDIQSSLAMVVRDPSASEFFQRVFHGAHVEGGSVVFFKPTEAVSAKPWTNVYVHPKTKRPTLHTIYGGKLTGIMIQSLCREIFFRSLVHLNSWMQHVRGVELLGQFHDEVITDWTPQCPLPVEDVRQVIEGRMAQAPGMPSFPIAAEVKSSYRYNK